MEQDFFNQLPPNGSQESRSDDYKPVPKKNSRKARINEYIKRIEEDNMEQVLEDILKENKRLHSEIDTARKNLASAKKEYEELVQSILTDRLNNQSAYHNN